jgi:hypothetical protein
MQICNLEENALACYNFIDSVFLLVIYPLETAKCSDYPKDGCLKNAKIVSSKALYTSFHLDEVTKPYAAAGSNKCIVMH